MVSCSEWSLSGAFQGGSAFGWPLQGNDAFAGYAAAGVVPFAYCPEKQDICALLAVQRGKKQHEYTLPGGKIKAEDQRDARRTTAREAHEETHGLLSQADVLAALTIGGGDLCADASPGATPANGKPGGSAGKGAPGKYFPSGRYALFPLHLPRMWQLPAMCADRLAAGRGHPEAAKVLGLSWLSLQELALLRDQGGLKDPHSGAYVGCNQFILRAIVPGLCAWLRKARDDMKRHQAAQDGTDTGAKTAAPPVVQVTVVSASSAAAAADDELLLALSSLQVKDEPR